MGVPSLIPLQKYSATTRGSQDAPMDTKEGYAPDPMVEDDNSSTSSGNNSQKTFLATGHEASEAYMPIAKYEGRHRYDPSFRWTEDEEKKLVRKVRIKAP